MIQGDYKQKEKERMSIIIVIRRLAAIGYAPRLAVYPDMS